MKIGEYKTSSLSLLIVITFSVMFNAQPIQSHIESPQDKSTIVIGGDYNYPPYEFLDKDGSPAGYNVELTQAIAKTMGLDVDIVLSPWGETREKLLSGKIDAIHGMFYSEEREKVVDFSSPHAIIHHSIFARKDSPEIESVEDLRGKEIILMRGDIMHDYAVENKLSNNILLVETQAKALRLIASGKYDFALIAKLPGFHWVKELKLSNITTVGKPITQEQYCYAVREGNAEMLAWFNEGLAILKNTGEYDQIYKKWLGIMEPRGIPRGTLTKYSALVMIPLFLLLVTSIIWSQTLRKKVSTRTRHLEREITARKQAEKKIKETKDHLDNIIEGSIDCIVATSSEGYITRTNSSFMKLLGYEKEEVTGKHIAEFSPTEEGTYESITGELVKIDKEFFEIAETIMTRLFEEKKLSNLEFYLMRKDRKVIPVEENIVYLYDEKGDMTGGVAVIRDFSERRRKDREIKEARIF